jgi:cell division protein FtsB
MPTPTVDRPHHKAAPSRSGKSAAARPSVGASVRQLLTRPVRHVLLALIVVVIGGAAGVLPFGTRSIQDEAYSQSLERLEQLQRENESLTEQRDLLNTDEEVARIAREEFGLAPNDATIYAIPELRPDNGDRDRTGALAGSAPAPEAQVAPKRGMADKVIDFLVFWD